MKARILIGLMSCVASGTSAAEECMTLDVAAVNKALPEAAPWHLQGGGISACNFTAGSMDTSFDYNLTVRASAAAAQESARAAKADAMTRHNRIDALPALGGNGFAYSPKDDAGVAKAKTVFFFGSRNNIEIIGDLTLKQPVTPAQRDAVAGLIAAAAAAASNPTAQAAASNCPYFDMPVLKRLLPAGEVTVMVPAATNCIASVGGAVAMIGVVSSAQSAEAARNMMKGNGCKVDPLPQFGDVAGISHHCQGGNPRAQVLVVEGAQMYDYSIVLGKEPTPEQRALLVQLVAYALSHGQ
jgi:hypothetical protein